MHAISSYRGNRPTHTQTHTSAHPQANRQDLLQYTGPQLARGVIKSFIRNNKSFVRNNAEKLCTKDLFRTQSATSAADLHNNFDKKDIHVSAIQLSRIKFWYSFKQRQFEFDKP